MFYDAELTFLKSLLNKFNLNQVTISGFHDPNLAMDQKNLEKMDRGFRKNLGLELGYAQIEKFLQEKIRPRTIFKITDSFYCSYFIIMLPDTEPSQLLVIGPYRTSELANNMLVELIEKYKIPTSYFPSIQKHFSNIPLLISDSTILNILNTFGE
jgi:hypothetical protein